MINKRGVELAVGTIVIIVLAVVVLVVIIVGFTSGWGNLWNNISAFIGGTNADTQVKACEVACTTQAKNAWCSETRDVTYKDSTGAKKDLKKTTCEKLFADPIGKGLGFKDCSGLCSV